MQPLQLGVVEDGVDRFVGDIAAAIPRILSGLIFLILAGVLAKVVMMLVRAFLRRALDEGDSVYRRFVSAIVAAFLWFGIALSFLSIVGLDEIASSMGTAAGFLALGVSYSLSNMIADAVSGVYLLRDPDFMPGDKVQVGDVTGTVRSIELRKTRFTDENDDTVVRGNAEIEKKWTKLEDEEEIGEATDGDAEAAEEVKEETTEAATADAEESAESAGEELADETESVGEEVRDAAEEGVDDWSDATK